MEHLSDDHKDHLNPKENSHKLLHDEKGHPFLSFNESRLKLRQHDQNLSMERK